VLKKVGESSSTNKKLACAAMSFVSSLSPLTLLSMASVAMDKGLGGVCLPLRVGEVYDIDGFRLEVTAKCPTATNLFEVSEIRGHRGRGPSREYLTVYKGYESEPSWQPLDDFMEDGVITNTVLLRYLSVNVF
jgi:hypothetical protein